MTDPGLELHEHIRSRWTHKLATHGLWCTAPTAIVAPTEPTCTLRVDPHESDSLTDGPSLKQVLKRFLFGVVALMFSMFFI